MSRLYAIETAPTLTGANADWVRRVKPSAMDALVQQILDGVANGAGEGELEPLVADLLKGSAVVVTGSQSSPRAQAAAHDAKAAAAAHRETEAPASAAKTAATTIVAPVVDIVAAAEIVITHRSLLGPWIFITADGGNRLMHDATTTTLASGF